MKDSGNRWIGKIPESWDTKKLKYGFDIFSGSTPDSGNADYWDGDIVWVTPADYNTEGMTINDSDKKLTKSGYNACGTKITPPQSLIFSKRAPVGKVAINNVSLCTNQGCFSCIPHEGIDSKFFYYVMSISAEVFELVSSGSTFKEISADAFKSVKLPEPSISEQHAIAAYLDRKCGQIDDIIADLQRQIACLESYKKSLISEAVTKGLNPDVPMKDSGIEWIGQIPEHWETRRLGYVANLQNGYVGPIAEVLVDEASGEMYIQSLHVKNGNIKFDGDFFVPSEWGKRHPKIHQGDLVIVQTGDIGQIGLVTKEYDGKNCHALIICHLNQNIIFPTFAKYYFLSNYGVSQ